MLGVSSATSNISYECNPAGIRTKKIVDGVATTYLVDENRSYAQVLEERDSSGKVVVAYTYGDDLISQRRDTAKSYYHYDGLGSTRVLTNNLGTVTDTYNYDAFGELLNKTGTTVNNYLYTGEQYDPNLGFYYLRARYMNPSIGRFINMDSWEGNSYDPVTLHKYLYANANPVNMIDPSGHMTLASTLTSVNIRMSLDSICILSAGVILNKVMVDLWDPGLTNSIYNPSLPYVLQKNAADKLEEKREVAKIEVQKARNGRSGRILYHYTDKSSAFSIYGSRNMYLTKEYRDSSTGQVFPKGAYATDIAPWESGMTQKKLAKIFYFNPWKQEKADLSYVVIILDNIPPHFVSLGGSQWMKPDGNINPIAVIKNPMP